MQRFAAQTLLSEIGCDLLALFGKLAASNDFAVHFGNDFLNQMHLGVGPIGSGKPERNYSRRHQSKSNERSRGKKACKQ